MQREVEDAQTGLRGRESEVQSLASTRSVLEVEASAARVRADTVAEQLAVSLSENARLTGMVKLLEHSVRAKDAEVRAPVLTASVVGSTDISVRSPRKLLILLLITKIVFTGSKYLIFFFLEDKITASRHAQDTNF